MTWNDQFLTLFRHSVEEYKKGNSDFMSHYTDDDLTFLSSIGYKPRELFDFVEDLVDGGEPTESTALLVAAARRDYFLAVQKGHLSSKEITGNDIPSKTDSYEEVSYLPRIIAKAEAKLRGELHPNLMYSCGGDRAFLRNHGSIHPADFLRHVWAADGDIDKVLAFVRSSQ